MATDLSRVRYAAVRPTSADLPLGGVFASFPLAGIADALHRAVAETCGTVAQIIDTSMIEYARWHHHHIIWRGTPYELAYMGELFEDRHWRDYQQRLERFRATGHFERRYGG